MEEIPQIPQPDVTSEPEIVPVPTPSHSHSSLFVFFITVVIAAVLVGGYKSRYAPYHPVATPLISNASPTILIHSNSPTPSPSPIIAVTAMSGVSWYAEPKPVSNLSLIKNTDTISAKDVEYFELGMTQDKKKIMYIVFPGDTYTGKMDMYCILDDTEKKCFTLRSPDTASYYEDAYRRVLVDGISVDRITVKGLNAPDTLQVNGVTYKLIYQTDPSEMSFSEYNKTASLTYIGETDFGSFYESLYRWGTSDIYLKKNILKLPSIGFASYTAVNYDQYDKGITPTWFDGTAQEDLYSSLFIGCGTSVSRSVPLYRGSDQMISVGKTQNGDEIFVLQNDRLMSALYDDYKIGRENSETLIPFDKFKQKKIYALVKNSLGEWQLFRDTSYSASAECGKPVIYLYPTTTQSVHVQVGAHITESFPHYPKDGWLVLAHPDGTLDYQQTTYTSLYWEGKGFGVYPDYTNRGIVVSQKQMISTLYSQMTQLGLTSQEQSDFMQFWQPRLPTTPYVRLTWLTTLDMDVLAPLQVTPTPDTSIRVFLEFEGMSEPRILIPQVLSAPKRTGFTLVEWGGLLRGKRSN